MNATSPTKRLAAARWLAIAMMMPLAGCGGGGDSNNAASTTPAPTSSDVAVYGNSLTLGSVAPLSLSYIAAKSTTNAMIVSPVAAPLLAAGSTPLVSSHFQSGLAGAGIACVSAPANSIGTVAGVNVGVNIKSVAVLLDGSWTVSTTPSATWISLGANAATFDGWENCGAKAEGSPSPSSTLVVAADGSFTDNVFNGNPSTTVNIVNQDFTASQAASMLSDAGYLDTSQAGNPQDIRLKIYQNTAKQTLLVEQGIPSSGATNGNPGYVAIYYRR
ncbi:hypothetical protein AWB64_02658 [Caballeronia sordidicola]|uniref:PASTA domain-containing protein n=2 Tax=Caballeronia sordidicola TaxID=196367 RepID=A0A158GDN5_CABSO|nr:hypothetical protein AWB64_02658 [Caballeronia sordidicola]